MTRIQQQVPPAEAARAAGNGPREERTVVKRPGISKAGMQNKITFSIDHKLLINLSQSPGHTGSQLECRTNVDNVDNPEWLLWTGQLLPKYITY